MLSHAHKGYDYQDLLVALRLVDVLLGRIEAMSVDQKLFAGDLFDDLTTVERTSERERVQFKYNSNSSPLTLSTFTSQHRDLRLDAVFEAALKDLRDFDQQRRSTYRIVLTDKAPTSHKLLATMEDRTGELPAYVKGFESQRFTLKSDVLWPKGALPLFGALRNAKLERADITLACQRIVIETGAPSASFDLTNPGPAESLLLQRLREEVGAGIYPNERRSPLDVAQAFIAFAKAARQGTSVRKDDLATRAQLRRDFGAVSRANPVDSDVAISRRGALRGLTSAVKRAAQSGGIVLLTGPPGQGKSWLSHGLHQALKKEGWLIAEHYCYLGEADTDLRERVWSQAVFGSLLARLSEEEPGVLEAQRPRFEASPAALAQAIARAASAENPRKVMLIVDGLDHVDRVAHASRGPNNRARDLAAELAGMELPANAVLVVLSQPGPHLVPLESRATCFSAPPLTRFEVAALMRRLGANSRVRRPTERRELLSVLVERSRGNALYVTYLCRQIISRGVATSDVAAMLRTIPEFDGTLRNYYGYITRSSLDAKHLTGLLGALPFSATRQELLDLLEFFSRTRLDDALAALSSVLIEREAQGGVRIYHESFARYLAEEFAAETDGEEAMARWLRRVANWLSQRGFYQCPRSYRFLLPTLVRLGRFREVLDWVGVDFVALSIRAGFMPAAIHANLSTAVGVAVRVGEWPAVVRCVELSRAASTFEEDRLAYTWAEHADVGLAMLGDERFVSSLLFDGRCTVPGRAGILLCAAADKRGLTPPWQEYLSLLQHQEETTGAYGGEADREAVLARFRGWVRLYGIPAKHLKLWKKVLRADELLGVVADVEGYEVAEGLAVRAGDGDYLLAMAELQRGRAFERACDLAKQAANLGVSRGQLHRLIPFDALPPHSLGSAEASNLVRLTAVVQGRQVRFELHHLQEWQDEVSATCGNDPRSATAIEALISEAGWYPCWLKFMVRLAAAEARARTDESVNMLEVLRVLEADLNPFAGPLRTMDLYGLRLAISPSFGRALSLVKDAEWSEAFKILARVSHATTVSFRGEQGGPLTPDDLFELVNEFTTPTRCAQSIDLIEELLREGKRRCYYSFLAAQNMRAARLALKGGALDRAKVLWVDACTFSVGYGFRKDTTLWELLDCIPDLDKLDRHEVRKRLAAVQPLCTRVLNRTDGKETHAARRHWWRLLATSDPLGLANCVVPELLRQTNEAREVLEGAIDDLWAANATDADVIVAAAARLSNSCGVHRNDVHLAHLLVDIARNGPNQSGVEEDLNRLCLARLDEHPLEQSGSADRDGDRSIALLLAEINAQTSGCDVPDVAYSLPVATVPQFRDGSAVAKRQLSRRIDDGLVHCFGRGVEGITSAIEHYTSLGIEVPRVPKDVNRFANIVGYRLLVLIDEGKVEDAESVLRAIADSGGFSGESELLIALGEGLEKEGSTNLAAAAYTWAWVCARGDGGWTGFGGKGGLQGLVRAFELSKEKATEIVAAKVQEILAEGDYRTLGVSKAIVRAVASVPSLRRQAFDTWDECYQVISRRLPLVAGEVDSGPFYLPLEAREDGASVDRALMLGAVAAIAHPGVERKRRGLLAFQLLLSARPRQMGSVACSILQEISDPSTLTWLLSVLFRHENRAVVVPDCVAALQSLAMGGFLVVRALARRILGEGGHACEPPPVSDPDAELFMGNVIKGSSAAKPDSVESAIREQAGDRLAQAERMAPGIARAVSRRVHRAAASAEFKERLDGQLEALADRSEQVWPEGFLALEEEIETAVQLAAAGARTAAAAQGLLGQDPADLEDALAYHLWDDPMLALELEAARMNRPGIAPPLTPAEWDAVVKDQCSNVRHAICVRELCGAHAPRLRSSSSSGWRIVGSSEARIVAIGDRGRRAVSKRTGCIGAAFDRTGREQTEWFRLTPEGADARKPERNSSLVRSFDSHFRNTGLRLRSPILQLDPALCARFGLSPSRGFALVDGKGKAVAMRTFRADYTRGDYALARPRLIGSVLLMREDVFDECASQWGDAFSWKESIWWITGGDN